MTKKIQLSLLLLIFVLTGINTQATEKIKNLQIGDKVPNIRINNILNGNKKKAKIADFKDQLLILDFMHTGCGGCLHALPGMDSLQSLFNDQFKIMVVTPQKEDHVQHFLDRKDIVYGKLQIPWVVEDDILREYFKYRVISHLVWIYKGEVVAITDKYEVTKTNVQDVLNGKKVNLPVKNDLITFDINKNFFNVNVNQGSNENGLLVYSAFRSFIKGIDAAGERYMVDSVNKTFRYHIANQSILQLYNNAWKTSIPSLPSLKRDQVVWEVKDPSRYEYLLEEYDIKKYHHWEQQNKVSYESILPLKAGKKGANIKLINDLDNFFGLYGRWEKRKVPCYVIVKAGTEEDIKAKKEQNKKLPYWSFNGRPHNRIEKGTSIFRQETMMKYFLYRSNIFDKPLIDESQYEGTFIFPLYNNKNGNDNKYEKKDLQSFKKGLKECGFDIIEKERETDVFVLTEVWGND